MNKEVVMLESLQLIGITARTNNKNEMDPEKSKIADVMGRYWSENIAEYFHNRVAPGITYAIYTDYESDEHGDYTYFLGELVHSFDQQDNEKFKQLTIPASRYQKLTTETGKMPDIIINAWQEIWQMQPSDFDGKRRYIADFEVYDHRAIDPNNATIDIYIGVE